MNSKNTSSITVQTTIQATIHAVWDYWTMPKHIVNWNFAHETWCCPNATNDLKPGGEFSWRMEAKDGSMGFDFTGTYNTIIENKLITYNMQDGRLVKIDFVEQDNHVVLSETFEIEGSNSDEQQRDGWQAILENFKNYVESNTKS